MLTNLLRKKRVPSPASGITTTTSAREMCGECMSLPLCAHEWRPTERAQSAAQLDALAKHSSLVNIVKEEIFVGEKFRTFPSKTFRMEFNFVLSEWLKEIKQEETIERSASQVEENLVWTLVSYFFLFYESYEIKFSTKISSFTVVDLFGHAMSTLHVDAWLESETPRSISRQSLNMHSRWSLCSYVIVHTILLPSPVISWIELRCKPKWLPWNFLYHDVMRTAPIGRFFPYWVVSPSNYLYFYFYQWCLQS